MRILLDEMYPTTLAELLRDRGTDVATILEMGRAGTPDPEVFALACEQNRVLLTENVADFVQLAAAHNTAGRNHPGVLIALSSRFSRRPAGEPKLVVAITAQRGHDLTDRVVFLP